MKLGIMKQEVLEHGISVTKEDLVFPYNICPDCGYDISDEENSQIECKDFSDYKGFVNIRGKRATFDCPQCGCRFKREIVYKKRIDWYYLSYKISNWMPIIMILSLIIGTITAVRGLWLPTVISFIMFFGCLLIKIIISQNDE